MVSTIISQQRLVSLTTVVLLSMFPLCWAFLPRVHMPTHSQKIRFQQSSSVSSSLLWASSNDSDLDWSVLHDRLVQCQVSVLEQEIAHPPHADLTATDFCQGVLEALWDNGNPLPDSGFRVLLRSSTRHWRQNLYDSVAAPATASEEAVASALGEALRRPQNQFAILVEETNEDEQDDSRHYRSSSTSSYSPSSSITTPPYSIEFPTDVVDYGDGTCWVECRLRGRSDGNLWVVMGWQLQRRSVDGAWLVHHMDWQDFRDEFRPGIGREEWMRICG